jgi:hypothetical protein
MGRVADFIRRAYACLMRLLALSLLVFVRNRTNLGLIGYSCVFRCLGLMLGVRRASVNKTAQALQA